MHPSRTAAFAASIALAMTAAVAHADTPVPLTSCGQEVGGTVYLEADLDCTGQPGHGVWFSKRGTLELRGFTLSNAELDGVECSKSCTILGPGAIVDAGGQGVRAANGGMNRITDVTVSGSGTSGVVVQNGRITGSTIENNGAEGIFVGGTLKLTDSVVTGNAGEGLLVPGFDSCRRSPDVRSSTITGNGGDADVVTCKSPKIDDLSTCGTSLHVGTTDSWGVCSLD